MTNEKVIIINSLSKTYKLYRSHRDRIKELFHPLHKCYHQKYYALRDINLTVEKGEVIGIIGQNGSGKSTLLKILASVVTPSSGTYSINGKVTALLELGGGFDKNLSGVENIYFLCGLQGYRKKEMKQRLEQILDFADIGVYAYQNVNSYSSGMYVRLAFSLAINIDPDIIIIDEALAVGDIRFQQKCFRKIREFKESGKTMFLCTHSLAAVRDFCTRAIWLHEGKIMEQGDPIFVTDCYTAFMMAKAPTIQIKKQITTGNYENEDQPQLSEPLYSKIIKWESLSQCDSYGHGGATIQFVALYDKNAQCKTTTLNGGENVRIYMHLITTQIFHNIGIVLKLNGQFGTPIFIINTLRRDLPLVFEINKPYVVAIDFTFPNVGNGRYTISLGITDVTDETNLDLHWVHDALILEVTNPDHKYKQGTLLVIEESLTQVSYDPVNLTLR